MRESNNYAKNAAIGSAALFVLSFFRGNNYAAVTPSPIPSKDFVDSIMSMLTFVVAVGLATIPVLLSFCAAGLFVLLVLESHRPERLNLTAVLKCGIADACMRWSAVWLYQICFVVLFLSADNKASVAKGIEALPVLPYQLIVFAIITTNSFVAAQSVLSRKWMALQSFLFCLVSSFTDAPISFAFSVYSDGWSAAKVTWSFFNYYEIGFIAAGAIASILYASWNAPEESSPDQLVTC